MTHPICATCGTQFAASDPPPAACAVCSDERQYVAPGGQRWTTLEALRATHRNAWQRLEPGLYAVATEPRFAIGQRALLVRTPQGNVLWDCLALLDDATIDIVRALGGLRAIAISHPHYYTAMVEWARAFDAPVLVHAADRAWVMRSDPVIHFWDGATFDLEAVGAPSLTLVRAGGHFEGGAVLHWAAGADGRGTLLTGDIVQVVPDRRWVSFMRSYPNLIPLDPASVQGIVAALAPYPFERVYGAFADMQVERDAKGAVARSAARYVSAITRGAPPGPG